MRCFVFVAAVWIPLASLADDPGDAPCACSEGAETGAEIDTTTEGELDTETDTETDTEVHRARVPLEITRSVEVAVIGGLGPPTAYNARSWGFGGGRMTLRSGDAGVSTTVLAMPFTRVSSPLGGDPATASSDLLPAEAWAWRGVGLIEAHLNPDIWSRGDRSLELEVRGGAGGGLRELVHGDGSLHVLPALSAGLGLQLEDGRGVRYGVSYAHLASLRLTRLQATSLCADDGRCGTEAYAARSATPQTLLHASIAVPLSRRSREIPVRVGGR